MSLGIGTQNAITDGVRAGGEGRELGAIGAALVPSTVGRVALMPEATVWFGSAVVSGVTGWSTGRSSEPVERVRKP